MTLFLLIAAALVGLAVLLLTWPLLQTPSGVKPALWSALAIGFLLPVGAGLLYYRLSNYDWTQSDLEAGAGVPSSVEEMVDRLEKRMAENPTDPVGFAMLGRSQLTLKNYPKAVAAFEKAYALTQGKDAEIDARLAEVLAMADPQSLSVRGAQLLSEALKADPNNPRALWYGGVVAFSQGDKSLARTRWMTLLELHPPADVVAVLVKQIRQIDAQLGSPADPRLAALESNQQAASEASADTSSASATQDGVRVRVRVSVADKLSDRLKGPGTLFVFAQDPQSPGPPLAVKRFPAGTPLPLDVDLSAADAMIPSRSLAQVTQAKIVARFSVSGQPIAQHGDVYGELSYPTNRTDRASLVLDQLVP